MKSNQSTRVTAVERVTDMVLQNVQLNQNKYYGMYVKLVSEWVLSECVTILIYAKGIHALVWVYLIYPVTP